MSDRRKLGDTALDVLLFAGLMGAGLYVFKTFMNPLLSNLIDPEKEKQDRTRNQAKAHLERLNRRQRYEENGDDSSGTGRMQEIQLNEYENLVALEMVAPEDIPVGFDDIGGLDAIIEEIREAVIYPLTMPHLYAHAGSLLSAPSGVLLFGPPGCGKTMLAKALAHESGAAFINLHISTMTEKWYGDSNKIVRAVFSLARKMQPAIIFIDEIDALLGTRRSGEHEASGMVKAEFMTLWDGLTSSDSAGKPAQICVLGATNRINDIDEAILRRMPKKFPVPLPGREQRRKILQLLLRDSKMDPDNFDIDYVAKVTAGMSGSDLKEVCRDAAMAPVREYLKAHRTKGQAMPPPDPSQFRGIRNDDFLGRRGQGGVAQQNATKQPESDEYEDVEELPVEQAD